MEATNEERAYVRNAFKTVYKKADLYTNYAITLYAFFGLCLATVNNTWTIAIIGALSGPILYYGFKLLLPNKTIYQYIFSLVIGLYTVQYIYQMHGMMEMRLIIFVGAIILIYYQQWRLIVPFSAVLLIHHILFAYLQQAQGYNLFYSNNGTFSIISFLLMLIINTIAMALAAKWSHDSAKRTKVNAVNDFILYKQLENVRVNVAFAQQLSHGNLIADYELRKDDELGISLVSLRDSLKFSKQREDEEKFLNTGLAKASEILRANNNLNSISEEIIIFLVKYMKANQGALFILQNEDQNDRYLEMLSCYAYNKKKFITKKVLPGHGLVGQALLEREPIYLTKIPENYISITSGLGEALPRAVLIIPLIVNEKIFGVIEMASFSFFEKSEIDFMMKVGESIASSISIAKINKKTNELLQESQMLTEQTRSQEELMRSHLEELNLSQGEMSRKQSELEESKTMLNLIIDLVPFPIFVKDSKGCYTIVNVAQAELFDKSVDEFIGKSDDFFVSDPTESELIRETDRQIIEDQEIVNIPEQILTLFNGTQRMLQTTKVPFFNNLTNEFNILGVSIDVTERKLAEERLKFTLEEMGSLQGEREEKQKMLEKELQKIKESFNGVLNEIANKNNINVDAKYFF